MNTKRFYLLLSFALLSSPCLADNWAHWRGPTGNGAATEGNPPTKWSATENVKWKVAIPGKSSGSPVIWEDRVFVVTAVPTGSGGQPSANERGGEERREGAAGGFGGRRGPSGRGPGGRGGPGGGGSLSELEFKVLYFDRATGNALWERTATTAKPHQATHSTNGFASASPCTDGQHVYAHFGSRGLYCYTMDGELKWKRDDFGPMNTRNDFGEGSSPTIEGDMILVPWDHEGPSSLYAINKLTGETVWQTARDEPTCWATPLVVEYSQSGQGGSKQIVMNGQTCARAYDLQSGKELWRCGGQTQRPVASAVARDGLVIVGSGFQGSFMGAFRMNGQGDIEGTSSVVWTLDRDTPDIASPLLSGDRVYFHKGKTGQLTCVDAETGKEHYTAVRVPDINTTYASPIAAGGHVYLTGRSGNTVVITDSDEFNVVAKNSVGETVDATPAPVDNELFIRGENHLFCIAE